MAINSLTASSDKIPLLSLCSLNSSKGSIIPNRLLKINFATDSSVKSCINKSNKIRKNTNCKSPYLNSDKVHLLSRVTEKRVVQKKAADFVSSFPLAVKIYKANSDEFKCLKQSNKRPKKSVLTLPNEQTPAPQTCTVSDMNDSEDFSDDEVNRKKRPKKRPVGQNNRARNDFEFYDRDARYCSQFNIHLDRSSTDVIRNFNGDGKKTFSTQKQPVVPKTKTDGKFNGHDVWRVLRNINRFQFTPSPPMSEESIVIPRKKDNQMRFSRKDTRFIETCRTEEFAYISSIEVDSKSPPSFSHSSSFDRVTVIDKKDEFSKICEEFEKRMSKTQNVKNSKNQKFCRNKNKSLIKKSLRTCSKVTGSKESNQHTVPANILLDLKSSYENSEPISNYSSSLLNEAPLTLSVPDDGQQTRNECRTKPILKTHQIQNKNNIVPSEKINNMNSSVNSVSSKTGGENLSKAHQEVFKVFDDKKSSQPLNGITKVVLSKGQDLGPSKRLETSKRKPRLATTLTNTSIMPKMTQTNIRRRLLNMKFPLVILGKDQVSSTIPVMDYDPPQFEGLDKHIWPFMIEWSDNYKLKAEVVDISNSNEIINLDSKCNEDSSVKKRTCHSHGDYKFNKVPNKKVDISISNHTNNRERKWIDSKFISKKLLTPALDTNNKPQEPKKQKPIRQFKDKMLKLLYKKPLMNNISELNPTLTGQYLGQKGPSRDLIKEIEIMNKTDVTVKNNDNLNTNDNTFKTRQHLNTRLVETSSVTIKRPWAKAKWASDFIENVIKKIKSGVYYSQDIKYEYGKTPIVAKEASVQTKLVPEKLNKKIACDTTPDQATGSLIRTTDRLIIIPGFDNSLSELEVQTLDTSKIEIKNCLANIIVQFDISVPKETDKLSILAKKSCSLIPIEKNDSTMKLFKCKATIFNAMLPAELCAILPDMMRKIVHSDIKSSHPLPINKTDSQLSTISELSHFEGFDSARTVSKLFILSPKIRQILSGRYSHSNTRRQTLLKIKNIILPSSEITYLLPIMPKNIFGSYLITPMENIFKKLDCTIITSQPHKNNVVYALHNETCKTLQPYNYQQQSIIATSQSLKLANLFKNMWNAFKMFNHINLSHSIHQCTISIDLLRRNESIETKKIVIKIDKLKLDSLFENYVKTNSNHNNQRALDGYNDLCDNFTERDSPFFENKAHQKINHIHGGNHKIKRKGFVKLYKKCKSTSNIPNEKNNFPLSKITNLDDFFQLLGSKSVSCVFDGNSGKKILSSVTTMKNWISEISSRQAILVLLLANKKDTPNLIRFRPVLLQGIAVNRITRATELDMEIEVIERENLNILSQVDGISYLPASTENKDNLLEELNWIAKTTASDYQKPFDESSEKLLKSLLEKRKQLNPSYLRVMARYVGLGLLKSPTKKINLRC